MSNPFLEPRSILVEQERKRRERFKVSVYVGLSAMTVFLLGLLIQGCQRSDSPTATANSTLAETAVATNNPADATAPTNLAAAPVNQPPSATPAAEPKPDSKPSPLAAAVVASNPPVVQPVVNSTPLPATAAPNESPAPATAPAPAEEVYVIKTGDTLIRIAKDHHITVQAIKAANGLKTDRILAGKKLKLPSATTPGSTATGI